MRPPSSPLLAGVVALLLVGTATEANAQVHLPRIGQQYGSVGLTLQPGFLVDSTAPSDDRWSTVAPTGSGTARAGLHHILSRQLLMSGAVDLGLQWLDEHTADRRGRADSEAAFTWQLSLLARWLPFGERAGWSLGVGPHLYLAYLDDRPLQSLGGSLRLGRYLWQGDEDFVLLEFGYDVPFIQGLTRSNSISSAGTTESPAAEDWVFHRFEIGVHYGF